MNSSGSSLLHVELTDRIIGAFFDVYNDLGYGLLESVYRNALCLVLRKAGLSAEKETPIRVWFRGECVGEYRADILVNDCVVVEVKTAVAIDRMHQAQLMNYLRATNIEVGMILNFGPQPQFKRIAWSNDRKRKAASALANL